MAMGSGRFLTKALVCMDPNLSPRNGSYGPRDMNFLKAASIHNNILDLREKRRSLGIDGNSHGNGSIPFPIGT
ncbi:hypothetical protein SDJN02_05124, partial [Cucurbita argyrosperma subsp. argyrosperma]